MELHAQSVTAFFMIDQDMVLNVSRDENERVTGFNLFRGANAYEATRVQ